MDRSLYSKPYDKLREWLKEQRESQGGLTVRALSEKLETHHSIVGKIEKGDRKLDVVEFVQYCEALGVPPEEGLKIIKENLVSGKFNRPRRGGKK